MIQLAANILLTAATALVLWSTFAALLPSKRWWIRGWDFPRVQIAILAVVLIPLLGLFSTWWPEPLAGLLLVALIYQGARILPFTPLWRKEVGLAPRDPGTVKALAMNVEMTNRDYGPSLDVIRDEDPDILFVMETDRKWLDALAPVLDGYECVLQEPRDNYYGLVFATRLEVIRAEIVYLTADKDTPAVFAHLRDKEGRAFRFIGLHPQPPVPGVDTEERDAETCYAARFARRSDLPIVIMGDFNDAAWSDTSRSFKLIGEYIDPRVGRGMIASFDARSRFLRVPIDQMFLSRDIALTTFDRGPFTGSDHFPMIAEFSANAGAAEQRNRAPKRISTAKRKEIECIYSAHRDRLNAPDYNAPPPKPVAEASSGRDG